jgi:hypothetical protein
MDDRFLCGMGFLETGRQQSVNASHQLLQAVMSHATGSTQQEPVHNRLLHADQHPGLVQQASSGLSNSGLGSTPLQRKLD